MACSNCQNLACLSLEGCIEPFPNGTPGQTLEVCADGCACWISRNTDLGIAGTVITYTRYDGTQRLFDTCVDIVSKCPINALTDVDTATVPPVVSQVLSWDGANWVPSTPAVFTCANLNACSIDNLGDVDTTTFPASSGDTLLFNGTNWVNVNPCSVLTSCEIGDLGNVDTSILTPGDVLTFVGGTWVPQAPAIGPVFACASLSTCSIDDLADVVLTVPAVGESLIFNGSTWVNDFQCPINVTFVPDSTASTNPYQISWLPGLCSLNIPRPIYATIGGVSGAVLVPDGSITDIGTILSSTFSDSAGIADPGAGDIIIPRDGIYTLSGSLGVADGALCPGGTIFLLFKINAAYAGRYVIQGTTDTLQIQVHAAIPNLPLNAGDVISLGAGVVDCPTGGVVTSAYLGVNLVDA